jgi:hypothetical protein
MGGINKITKIAEPPQPLEGDVTGDVVAPAMNSPFCIKIDVFANLAAILVHLCPQFVDAILRATFCNQFVLCRLSEQDIDVALDLLGS